MSVPLGDPSLIHEDVEQGSETWLRLRLGKITCSRMKDVIAWSFPKPTKNNPEPLPREKSERLGYRKELVSERLAGFHGEKKIYVTEAMLWGSMNENIARQNYQLRYGRKVRQVGIIDHPELAIAYSPDGLVNDDGMIEVKCLEPWNHLYEIVKPNDMPEQFKAQVQTGLWITNRQWCDFIGYDSRMPGGIDLFSTRVERDEEYIKYLETQARQFLKEVEREVAFFYRYLAEYKRTCRTCGLVFTSRVQICPGCMLTNIETGELIEAAELKLGNIQEVVHAI
jgi:YqaJ-like viral recombinase domain